MPTANPPRPARTSSCTVTVCPDPGRNATTMAPSSSEYVATTAVHREVRSSEATRGPSASQATEATGRSTPISRTATTLSSTISAGATARTSPHVPRLANRTGTSLDRKRVSPSPGGLAARTGSWVMEDPSWERGRDGPVLSLAVRACATADRQPPLSLSSADVMRALSCPANRSEWAALAADPRGCQRTWSRVAMHSPTGLRLPR